MEQKQDQMPKEILKDKSDELRKVSTMVNNCGELDGNKVSKLIAYSCLPQIVAISHSVAAVVKGVNAVVAATSALF